MREILIIDSTLRDGNHAIKHQLNAGAIEGYTAGAELAKLPIVVVGHGNGLGASSLQVGESLLPEREITRIARRNLINSRLGVYMIPGFATINKNLEPAIEDGADVVCIGSHCTEVDTTKRYIEYARQRGKDAYANLMMVHMIPKERLAIECRKAQSYGASGVILMDSAGALLPQEVRERVESLVDQLDIPVGFHAHNNLGLAIANSLAATEAGATILDSCTLGFGAGAGNAQLEVLVAVLYKLGFKMGIDLYKMLDLAEMAEKQFIRETPRIKPLSIVSGLAGVFSGFSSHVERAARQYLVDSRDIFFELGRSKAVAGQEDLIVEVALRLSEKGNSNENKTH